MMGAGYNLIYITVNGRRGTELRCKNCPRWWADADWTVMDAAFKKADKHIEDAHQKATA